MFRNYSNYEVYPDGKIFSYYTNKFLKQKTKKNGYKEVCLVDNNGKIKSYLVHRIVWESVTGSPIPEGMQVNHINEDKTDNRFFENLNLMTPKQNINWGSGIERCHKSQSKQVGAFKDGELIIVFPSTNEAGRNGFDQGNVTKCCNGERKTHKGYTWKYL